MPVEGSVSISNESVHSVSPYAWQEATGRGRKMATGKRLDFADAVLKGHRSCNEVAFDLICNSGWFYLFTNRFSQPGPTKSRS